MISTATSNLSFPMLFANIEVWLVPTWFLSIGVTCGVLVLLALYALVWILSKNRAAQIREMIGDSFLQPLTYTVGVLVLFCIFMYPMMPNRSLLSSLKRLPYVHQATAEITIPAGALDQVFSMDLDTDELKSYTLKSEQDLVINTQKGLAFSDPLIELEGGTGPGDGYSWSLTSANFRKFQEYVSEIYITNTSDVEAVLLFTYETDIPMTQVHDLPWIAFSLIALYIGYIALNLFFPYLSAIAAATTKEITSQPIFFLAVGIGMLMMLVSIYIPYNTFGEDLKMLKDSCVTTIMIFGILLGVWTASSSIADEIEGKTALTLLSKPISRRQFILGKFFGILLPILLLFILVGIAFLMAISFKVIYDARESSQNAPDWQACYYEVRLIIPGLVLAFFQTTIMAAVSIAISTRLPVLPNLVICASVYIIGNLASTIVNSDIGNNAIVQFMGQVIAIIFPVLDLFDGQSAVAGGIAVPWVYVGGVLIYTILYCTVMIFLALALFEDRDLA